MLILAHETLTAYQLLMQQAEYSVQMGSNRFISPLLFDRLLSLNLTDLYVCRISILYVYILLPAVALLLDLFIPMIILLGLQAMNGYSCYCPRICKSSLHFSSSLGKILVVVFVWGWEFFVFSFLACFRCMSLEARESFKQVIFETAAFGNPLLNRLCTGALFT